MPSPVFTNQVVLILFCEKLKLLEYVISQDNLFYDPKQLVPRLPNNNFVCLPLEPEENAVTPLIVTEHWLLWNYLGAELKASYCKD